MKAINWIAEHIFEIFFPAIFWIIIWPWALNSALGFYIGVIPPIIVGLLCQAALTIDFLKTKIGDMDKEKFSSIIFPGATCCIALLFYSAGVHEPFFIFGFYWIFASILWLVYLNLLIPYRIKKGQNHKN